MSAINYPKCLGCSRDLLSKSEDLNHCDDCFVCKECRRRKPYCDEDPPPFGSTVCWDCILKENAE